MQHQAHWISTLAMLAMIYVQAYGADAMIQPHPIPADGQPSAVYRLTVNDVEVPVVDWYGPYAYAHLSYGGDGHLRVVITVPEADQGHTNEA